MPRQRRPFRTVEEEHAIQIMLLACDTPTELELREGQKHPALDNELIEEVRDRAMKTLVFENIIFRKFAHEERQAKFRRYYLWQCPEHPDTEPIVEKGRVKFGFKYGDTGRKRCTECDQSSVEVSLRLVSTFKSSRQLQTIWEYMGLL